METWINALQLDSIADEVGTPFYVYSRETLQKAWMRFDRAFDSHPHQICYAVKANSNLAVLNTFAELGSGFDIVSKGELARVIQAKGDPHKVVFSGVGKQPDEIAYAIERGIQCFNVESEAELLTLNEIASYFNTKAPIALRINPNVDPKSHPYISTGLKDNKFGIGFEKALSLYEKANHLPHLFIKGIACHIGSQLTSLSPFIEAFQSLLNLTAQLKEKGILLEHLDAGGGLGVHYLDETPPSIEDYAHALLSCTPPASMALFFEPGRLLTAPAGALITRVLSLKDAGNKRFCIVDAGMNDLIRPALYDAWHEIIPLKHSQSSPTLLYDVVGPICESGDFLGKDRSLCVNPGDLLAICQTGAYGFVTSSNYNSRPRIAEVMVSENKHKIVRRRETIEELWALETLW
jgi:diaminopimelate decarboxylase